MRFPLSSSTGGLPSQGTLINRLSLLNSLLSQTSGFGVAETALELLEDPAFLASEEGELACNRSLLAALGMHRESDLERLKAWIESAWALEATPKGRPAFLPRAESAVLSRFAWIAFEANGVRYLAGVARTLVAEETERLRAIAAAFPDLAFVIDSGGCIADVYTGESNVLSDRMLQFRGRPLGECFGEESCDLLQELVGATIRTGQSQFVEYGVEFDGSVYWFEGRSSLMSGLADPMVVLLARDVTERKASESRMKQLQCAIELSYDGIAIANTEGVFTFFNNAHVRMHGFSSEEEIMGKPWQALYPPAQARHFESVILPTVKAEGRWIGQIRARGADGEICPQEVLLTLLPDGGIIWACRDIAERLQAEVDIRNAKEEAEQLNEQLSIAIAKANQAALEAEMANMAKSEFLASMSHEIRTPMNAVIGMTSILLDTPLTSEQEEYLKTIRTSGDSLLVLINDILDFSKIESGRMDMEECPLDPRSCIEEALDLLAEKASSKGLGLAYRATPAVPYSIIGDVTRLRQIMVNLVGNAVKFTATGQVVVKVDAQELADGVHRLGFCVKDSGIGIPKDKQNKLFQSFSQVDSSTTRKFGGTGLGLAISKRLAELMGGEMWVESEDGEGAEFHFTLLAKAAKTVGYDPAREKALAGSLSGKRCLIVESNAVEAELFAGYVRDWGLDATFCRSGAEAKNAWVAQGPFDVVAVDYRIGDTDPGKLAAELRSLGPAQKRIGFVLLCPFGRQGDSQIWNASAVKPSRPSALLESMARSLNVSLGNVKRDARSESGDEPMSKTCPLRILLAEDNTVNQKVATLMLKKQGYKADIANNGLEVLEALSRQDYDLILMDVQMPEMDGLEAVRAIRAKYPESKRPWVIALTANAMQGDKERALASGMDDYLSKPIKPTSLFPAIERGYHEAQARSAARN